VTAIGDIRYRVACRSARDVVVQHPSMEPRWNTTGSGKAKKHVDLLQPNVAFRARWSTVSVTQMAICHAIYTEQVDHVIPLNGTTVCRLPDDRACHKLSHCNSPIAIRHPQSQYLIDAMTVEVDDFKTPVLCFECLPDSWQMAHVLQYEACGRMIRAPLWYGDRELLPHLVGRHPPGYEPRAIVTLHGVRFDRALVFFECAHDRLQKICIGHDPFEMSVFVMNQRDMNGRALHEVDDIEGIGGVENDGRLPNVASNICSAAAQLDIEYFLSLRDTQHVVGCAFDHGQPRMRALGDRTADSLCRRRGQPCRHRGGAS
jgi:hypothetical protein